jgi:glycosyltransferase 2 family protein
VRRGVVVQRFPARRLAAGTGGILLAAAVAALVLQSGRLERSISLVQDANPAYIWLAAVAFLGSLVAGASAWRTTLAGCGSRVGRVDACTRYGVGSLLDSFLPARLGDAARVTLFARTLPGGSGVLVAAGALAAIELSHVAVQAALLAGASGLFSFPLLPVAALAGGAAAGVGVLMLLRHRLKERRVRHLLDGVDALLHDPRRGVRLIGWQLAATVCRIAAAAAVAASLGVHSPLIAAVIVTAALDLAGLLPIAPGNIGVTSAAVALALERAGVDPATAVACGLVFHGVQLLVGIGFGLVSAAFVAGDHPAARARVVRVAAAAACFCAVAASGVALLPVVR